MAGAVELGYGRFTLQEAGQAPAHHSAEEKKMVHHSAEEKKMVHYSAGNLEALLH